MSLSLKTSFSSLFFPKHQPEVGNLIRDLRQLVEHTQEQFAAVLGVSFSTLNRWENGHMQPSPLSLRQLQSLLEQLGKSSNPKLQQGSRKLLKKYRQTAEGK